MRTAGWLCKFIPQAIRIMLTLFFSPSFVCPFSQYLFLFPFFFFLVRRFDRTLFPQLSEYFSFASFSLHDRCIRPDLIIKLPYNILLYHLSVVRHSLLSELQPLRNWRDAPSRFLVGPGSERPQGERAGRWEQLFHSVLSQ